MGSMRSSIATARRRSNAFRCRMPNSHVRSCERPAKLSRRSRNVVFVYADESGKTFVSYDRPSALLGQFQNEKIGMVAQMLDQKLDGLANMAAH